MAAPIQLTRTHRVLIGVVVFGAVIIAGIGFAGSYAAVRELALQKGFGNFSYVFPIGIDAGICVLLALDLLLTWIRIPFPLLRQTAWLLTAATIAFNGAAAWPDPLGVGMHGVIPILFVVSVEAARHAIGRIADITADKHMEGVRLTRWMLSPVPTFLLWRRMKLWELRSYEQVIKLEQERLVYQARLRSRFGRSWRRKAPIEALIPLRLLRYGIPLTDAPPADTQDSATIPQQVPTSTRHERASTPGLTTALPPQTAAPRPTVPSHTSPSATPTTRGPADHTESHHAAPAGSPLTDNQVQPLIEDLHRPRPAPPRRTDTTTGQQLNYSSSARHSPTHASGGFPHTDAFAAHHYACDGITSADGRDITAAELTQNAAPSRARNGRDLRTHPGSGSTPGQQPTADSTPRRSSDQPQEAPGNRGHHLETTTSGRLGSRPPTRSLSGPKREKLTLPDRYYLAWMAYQSEHKTEPTAEQLSAYLATQGLHGRGKQPLSPSNLRRHFLPWRIYTIWAKHRQNTDNPQIQDVARDCASRNITGQYNRPITTDYITTHTTDFERRWQTISTTATPERPATTQPAAQGSAMASPHPASKAHHEATAQ
ncbi:DUF2637 domain-containing protein [Streptomyces pilosus]|uniref:DUF2637 domain-containing protein n=2 Tax=Streptomyces pilosus TaxID=28893 RepID=UPI00332BC294